MFLWLFFDDGRYIEKINLKIADEKKNVVTLDFIFVRFKKTTLSYLVGARIVSFTSTKQRGKRTSHLDLNIGSS